VGSVLGATLGALFARLGLAAVRARRRAGGGLVRGRLHGDEGPRDLHANVGTELGGVRIEHRCAVAVIRTHVHVDTAVVARVRMDLEAPEIVDRQSAVGITRQDPAMTDGLRIADRGGGGVRGGRGRERERQGFDGRRGDDGGRRRRGDEWGEGEVGGGRE
jgi:hypothetical protein